jgi:hypothetical protein
MTEAASANAVRRRSRNIGDAVVALFTTTAYPVTSLIEEITLGKIGLPEIQRPFVWPNVNVRNLFDSLYRGYPVGYLLFWQTGADPEMRRIGEHHDQTVSVVRDFETGGGLI